MTNSMTGSSFMISSGTGNLGILSFLTYLDYDGYIFLDEIQSLFRSGTNSS